MAKQTPSVITLLLLLLLAIFTEVEGATKLFVFGDSYVDTGNFLNSESYKPPSGITYPGKPAGRVSDGRILTDYVASFLKIEAPAPYALRNTSDLQYGMNFAHGGTGIFDTLTNGPNMTLQIDSFEEIIQQKVYTESDLASSVALVNAGGNDYSTFILKNGSMTVGVLTESLVKQMSTNLRRIQSFGVGKIAVGLLEPVGCMPLITVVSSYQTCIDTLNAVSQNHSQLLTQAVQELNKEVGKTVFITLDLYNTFLSSIDTMKKARAGNSTLMNPLQPCCVGVNAGDSCGSVDDKGQNKYTVCEKPELSFFWNSLHPSQNGWNAVSTLLQPSLGQLTEKNF